MTWLLGIAVLIASSCWLWWYSSSSSSSQKRGIKDGKMTLTSVQVPNGRLGWPLIGETLDFISHGVSSKPEAFMMKRRAIYGELFKTNILGSPTIVSTDAEVNKAVLQNYGRTFIPFYPKTIRELFGKASILQMNGSQQRKIHGLIGGFLKSPGLKAQITRDIEEYVKVAMAGWKEGELVYIQNETKRITFRVLVKALMSVEERGEVEELTRDFKEFTAGLICLPINLPGTQLYRSLQAKKRMIKLVNKIITRKLEKRAAGASSEEEESRDVADVLLKEITSHSGVEEDVHGHDHNEEEAETPRLALDSVAGNLIEMMIPGEDSVPILITLAIKYLSDCPKALQQLCEENMQLKRRKTQNGENLHWTDYMPLRFTQNVISETLRMGNIVNGIMRKALDDVEIKGNLIPKGWGVLASLRSVHYDEENYDNPYTFDPWRWQEREVSGCNHFTPFGGGHRLCPGLDLSRLEASIFLHHFTTSFSWVAEEDQIVNFPTVKTKRGLPVVVKPIPNLFTVDQIKAH